MSLRDAVEHAIKTNPEVQVESNQHLSRLEELTQARAGYKPSIDLNAATGYERTDNNSTRASGEDHRSLTRKEASLTLSQMLFDGFATQSEVERQNARVNAQRRVLESTSEQLGLKAVDTYIKVLLHRDLMALSSENLQAHARIYDQVELRSNSGVGRSSDLSQITGRRASASANMLSDEVNLKDAETNFLRVVGLLPRSLEPMESVNGKLPKTQDEAIQLALENHPTLRSANADVMAAMAQYKASKSALYPRLDLELGARYGDDLDGVEGRDDDLTAMLRLRYNLFAGGKDKARNSQNAHLINEAKEIRNNTYRQVVESIRLSWAAYDVTQKQLQFQQQHVLASEKTRDAYAKQFNLRKRSLLDLLDTENELYEARREKTKTWYDHQLSQYRLLVGINKLKQHLGIALQESPGNAEEIHRSYSDMADKSAVMDEVAPLRSVLQQPVSLQKGSAD
ncbi:MAG: TolC family outer membrane protein [Candidatus Thiodiazotropha sp.]